MSVIWDKPDGTCLLATPPDHVFVERPVAFTFTNTISQQSNEMLLKLFEHSSKFFGNVIFAIFIYYAVHFILTS
jgi:hypothetical protein